MRSVRAAPEVVLDERLLPHNIKRLIKAIGIEQTLKLLKALGGTRVALPKRMTENDAMTAVIGARAAQAVVDEFRKPYRSQGELREGDSLTLPKSDKIAMQIRDAAILASDDHTRTLALRYDLTERQVQNIRANRGGWPIWRKRDDRQAELFD